ncbi:MAG: hypothetical protein JJT75_08220 [Opitutales bacterium]|nr:hypothetical protein [Opitutales bacterium]MCH8539753.1 hypothetical protein [Opitutales bacterium]
MNKHLITLGKFLVFLLCFSPLMLDASPAFSEANRLIQAGQYPQALAVLEKRLAAPGVSAYERAALERAVGGLRQHIGQTGTRQLEREDDRDTAAAFQPFLGTWRTQARFNFNGENEYGDPVRIQQTETITFRMERGQDDQSHRFRYERNGNWTLNGRNVLDGNTPFNERSSVSVSIDTGFLKPIHPLLSGEKRFVFTPDADAAGVWRINQQGKLAARTLALQTGIRSVVVNLEEHTITLFSNDRNAGVHLFRLSQDGRRLYLSSGLPSNFRGNFATVPEEQFLRVSRQPYYPAKNWGGFADHAKILYLEKLP